MDRAEYLDVAKDIICNQRHNVHGGAENTFALIAAYWDVFLNMKLQSSGGASINLSPADVGVMMGLFKTARWQVNPKHQDNMIDNIGYLALSGELSDINE